MSNATKLRRNDVDELFDKVGNLGLTEVMMIGKRPLMAM